MKQHFALIFSSKDYFVQASVQEIQILIKFKRQCFIYEIACSHKVLVFVHLDWWGLGAFLYYNSGGLHDLSKQVSLSVVPWIVIPLLHFLNLALIKSKTPKLLKTKLKVANPMWKLTHNYTENNNSQIKCNNKNKKKMNSVLSPLLSTTNINWCWKQTFIL